MRESSALHMRERSGKVDSSSPQNVEVARGSALASRQRADGEASRGYRADRNERARREVWEELAETSRDYFTFNFFIFPLKNFNSIKCDIENSA